MARASQAVVTTILVGAGPFAVAYDSGMGELFVANSENNTVSVISDVSNTVVATIPVGEYPNGLAYDSGMGEVFVTNEFSYSVSVISDVSNTVVATVNLGGCRPVAASYGGGVGEVFAANSTGPFAGDSVKVISDVS